MNFQSDRKLSLSGWRPGLIAALLVLALGYAACGGSTETAAPTNTPPAVDTPAAGAAVTETTTTTETATTTDSTPVTQTETTTTAQVAPGAGVTQTQAISVAKVPPPAQLAEGAASKLEPTARNGMYKTAPEMKLDPKKYYYATFKTDQGDIKVQLFAQQSPLAVNSFIFLAREGFYNNTSFHRVLEGFMAQGGDPTGTGTGGPGYEFANETSDSLVFDRAGLLAMANAGPDTNGSQFFITFAPAPNLNGGYTIFGEVLEGADVLSKITRRDPEQNPTSPGDTLYTVIIEETDSSALPTPLPPPPTPTPFAPSSLDSKDRPLAKLSPAERSNHFNTAPEVKLDATKQYTATIKTSKGSLTVRLYADKAPIAVNNFVALANLGFYDGTPINQVSPEQAIVIGAPANIPTSDAGYKITAEVSLPITVEVGGIAYIPQRPVPNKPILSSSSQLLIALIQPPPEVNANFSFFGQVVDGAAILPQLTISDTIESVTVAVSK
ncbi:MAG: peptidylprolyl isomerase [Chloroflexi bacterium]|nr:peptidylprolyl isomerase [Chloroflexota bacterium]